MKRYDEAQQRLVQISAGVSEQRVLIQGATGRFRDHVNGVYVPTGDVQNGRPVYRKEGVRMAMWLC